tara:strand:+ start:394 stop:837 length:444 start_codon:yes stop_codon:yes gene_type:complete
MSDCKSAWVSKCIKSSPTHWGATKTWKGFQGSKVKMINMKSGQRTSFKYNMLKDELLVCTSGKIKAYYGDQDMLTIGVGELEIKTLYPGMALCVQSECPYRLEAIEDAVVVEVSKGPDSVIRLHDDYGRETKEHSEFITLLIERTWE